MTARVVLIDIETIATRDPRLIEMIRRDAIAKEPANNTRTELKASWHSQDSRERRANEALAKTSVDVLRAEILCVGVIIDAEEPHCLSAMWPGETEQNMLEQLAEELRSKTTVETVWGGHAVEGFDFPILINRWRRFGIVPPESFPQPHHGKWRGRVYDTMQRIPSGHGLGMVSQRDACLAYGLSEPKSRVALPDGRPMSGELVAEAFAAREYNTICNYCLDDMATLRELYNACTVGGEWGTWDTDAELELAISTIRASKDLPEQGKAQVILEVLAETGKIPRRFAGMGV